MKSVNKIIVKINLNNEKRCEIRKRKEFLRLIDEKCYSAFKMFGISIKEKRILKDFIEYNTLGVALLLANTIYFYLKNLSEEYICNEFSFDNISDTVTFNFLNNPKVGRNFLLYKGQNTKELKIRFLIDRKSSEQFVELIKKQCEKIFSVTKITERDIKIEKNDINLQFEDVTISCYFPCFLTLKQTIHSINVIEKYTGLKCEKFTYVMELDGMVKILLLNEETKKIYN